MRKSVVRTLRGVLLWRSSHPRHTVICRALVERAVVVREEDTIRDLIRDTFQVGESREKILPQFCSSSSTVWVLRFGRLSQQTGLVVCMAFVGPFDSRGLLPRLEAGCDHVGVLEEVNSLLSYTCGSIRAARIADLARTSFKWHAVT